MPPSKRAAGGAELRASDAAAIPGLFITGTDTGVGKTFVACRIIEALRERGLRVGVMKPVETGVGEAGALDAQCLAKAANSISAASEICPQRFGLPAAPNVAARAERRRVDLQRISEAFKQLRNAHEFMVVEGAGGLLVPLDGEVCMADLAHSMELPVLVVARASLGTINHTLLTLAEIERRGLSSRGVIISHGEAGISEPDAANLECLRELLGERLLGELPPQAEGRGPPPDWIDLDALLGRRLLG